MTRFALVRRTAAAALLASAFAAPGAALDVLAGLGPSDFQVGGLGLAEARAFEGAVPLDPADWLPATNSEAGSSGGTTLSDLGVPTVAAEVARSDDALGTSLGQPSPGDIRVLATPDLRETLGDALDGGGDDLGSLGELVDELGGEGGVLDDVLDDALDGGLLEDVPLDQLPVDELLDVIRDPDGLLGGLTGGLLGGGGRP